MSERQFSMVDTELVQDRRMQIGNADPIFDRFIAKLVGGSVNVTGSEAATGHDRAEGMAIVIAAVGSPGDRQTTKLTRKVPEMRRIELLQEATRSLL